MSKHGSKKSFGGPSNYANRNVSGARFVAVGRGNGSPPQKTPEQKPQMHFFAEPEPKTALARWSRHLDVCDHCNVVFPASGGDINALCETGARLYSARINASEKA